MCRDQYREYAYRSNNVKGLRMVQYSSNIIHLSKQVQTLKRFRWPLDLGYLVSVKFNQNPMCYLNYHINVKRRKSPSFCTYSFKPCTFHTFFKIYFFIIFLKPLSQFCCLKMELTRFFIFKRDFFDPLIAENMLPELT